MGQKSFLEAAESMQPQLSSWRQELHRLAETGFELEQTCKLVTEALRDMGCDPKPCGRAGVVADIVGTHPGKTILLRADMDALPMREESEEPFACMEGRMHACGHDMHTAMLLGAAALLQQRRDTLHGTVRLMFQPAEELLEGAKDMIAAGVLESPKVDAAVMLHVLVGLPIPTGTLIVSAPGISAPAADYFTITVQGHGCHGAMPYTGIDPLPAAAHILLGLQSIQTRELQAPAMLTIGAVHAGDAGNVIPNLVTMRGTLRTADEHAREHLKRRMEQMCASIGEAFRTAVSVEFTNGTPTFRNDPTLCDAVFRTLQPMLGESVLDAAAMKRTESSNGMSGSEDFAYVSHTVPTVLLALCAGSTQDGYQRPLHHPRTRFSETVLPIGAAAYAQAALQWLAQQNERDAKKNASAISG